MTLKISSDNIQSSGVSAGSYPNANVTVNTSGIITSIASGIVAGAGTFFTYTYTGDGTTTTFSGGSNMTVHNVIVAENGVVQYPTTDYTVSSTNIVFTSAPASGVLIQIRILAGGTLTPKITNITVTDSNYNNLDDTAVNTSGGYIKITGTDFFTGCQVVVGAVVATSVTFISNTEVRAQVPAQSAGTYTVYLTNSDGGVAIRVNGLNYSATPTWTTTSPLPSGFKNSPISLQLSATSNSSVTYSLQSGSTLPSGLTLSSSGLLSGTVTSISAETTYNFTVIATDGEAQDTPQAFQITIIISDLYYPLVTLHLPGNGTNLANNNTFLDGSTNNFTITRNGNTTQGTFSPFSQTGWSNYLGTSSERLTTSTSNSGFSFGTGDFTVEAWVYVTDTTNCMFFQMSTASTGYNGAVTNSVAAYIGSGATPSRLEIYAANSQYYSSSAVVSATTINQWHHFAIVRASGVTKAYWDGTVVPGLDNITDTFNYSTTYCVIGTVYNNTYALKGYISNFRVVKGRAVYTANFTPPTTALGTTSGGTNPPQGTECVFLTAQSNRFRDSSSNNIGLTVTGSPSVVAFSPFNPTSSWSAATYGGSGYFDGSGDWINPNTTSANLAFGTGDFTVEFWLNTSRGATRQYICDFRNNGSTGTISPMTAFSIIWGDNGADASGNWLRYLGLNNGNTAVSFDLLGVTLSNLSNQWNHIAIVRSSGTVYGYLNGVRKNSAADSTNYNVNCSVSIAAFATGLIGPYLGNISDFRVVKGTAVYTGTTYTVPTAPLTAITNTSLLLNFTNAGIYDATSKNVLETAGDAKISTVQSKWSPTSIYFDGTGDYLQSPDTELLEFGSGDFTIETWVRFNALPSSGAFYSLISKFDNSTQKSYSFYVYNNAGTYQLYFTYTTNGSTNINPVANGITVTTNTWYHYAVSRSGVNLRLFIDGTQVGSTYNIATDTIFGGTYPVQVGASTGANTLNGYLQDLRVTKGYARYTANFTPPTAAFAQQ